MTSQELILRHLTLWEEKNGRPLRFTSFTGAIRDARRATNRDVKTGSKILGQSHTSWLGTIGYLILLDQIGKSLRPVGGAKYDNKQPLVRALKHFAASLSEPEILAIYALRCSFAHDYGLCNWNSKDSSLQHHFVLGGDGPIVRVSGIPCDREFRSPQTTLVNMETLGDLVEQIAQDLVNLARAEQLEISLADGDVELFYRYSLITVEP
jgi:hypothetical protein